MADGVFDNLQVNGNITVTGTVDGVNVSDVLNQNVKTTASPTFTGATVNGNITVTGTVDGQDLSSRLNQNVKTTDNVTFNQGRVNNILRVMRESFFSRTITALVDLIVNGSVNIINGNLNVLNGRITGNGAIPTGATMMWWDDTPPAGFLECNNDLYPIASYPGLFSIIGDKFGKTGTFSERAISSITGSSSEDLLCTHLIEDNYDFNKTTTPSPDPGSDNVFSDSPDLGLPGQNPPCWWSTKEHAFDLSTGSQTSLSLTHGPESNSSYLTYKFNSGEIINGYAIEYSGTAEYWLSAGAPESLAYDYGRPESWKVQGSNDNINWVDLDEVEECIWLPEDLSNIIESRVIAWHPKKTGRKKKHHSFTGTYYTDIYEEWRTSYLTIRKNFVFHNETSYQYYKILFTKLEGSDTNIVKLTKLAWLGIPYINSEFSNLLDVDSDTKWVSQKFETREELEAEYLLIDVGATTPNDLDAYQLTCDLTEIDLAFTPNSWEFLGSNDQSTWTLLDTQIGVIWNLGKSTKTFCFSNSTNYRYYKIAFKESNGGNQISLSGIKVFTQSATHFAVPAMENSVPRGFYNFVKKPFESVELHKLGSAIENGHYSTYLKEYAFDDNTTYWASAQLGAAVNGVSWIGRENLTEPVKRIKYTNYSSANNNVSSIKVQYSTDNGTTWSDIQTWTVVTTANAVNELDITTPYVPSGTNHSIRLLANSVVVAGNVWVMNNLKFYSHVKQDALVIGSAVNGTTYPDYAFITNPLVTWRSNETGSSVNTNAYIGLDFRTGVEKRIKKIVITNGTTADYAPSSVKVQYSNDGTTWFDISTHAFNITANAVNTLFVTPYLPARYIRVIADADLATNYYWVIAKMYMIETYFEDPDMEVRYNVADGSTGYNVGTLQLDAVSNHTHHYAGGWGDVAASSRFPIARNLPNATVGYGSAVGGLTQTLGPEMSLPKSSVNGPMIQASDENRMKNTSCMFIIKY